MYLCSYSDRNRSVPWTPQGKVTDYLPLSCTQPHSDCALQAVGKTVMPVAVAHKIEVVSVRGMLGCFQGTLPRIANRARRQTGMRVRVVGRWKTHVGVVQRAAVRALQEFGVNHARVGLQGDVF